MVRVHRTVRMPGRPASELLTDPPSLELPSPATDRSGVYAPPSERAANRERTEPTPTPARKVASDRRVSSSARRKRPIWGGGFGRVVILFFASLIGMLLTLAGFRFFGVLGMGAKAGVAEPARSAGAVPTPIASSPSRRGLP